MVLILIFDVVFVFLFKISHYTFYLNSMKVSLCNSSNFVYFHSITELFGGGLFHRILSLLNENKYLDIQ